MTDTDTATPISASCSKKRELSSPEDLLDWKKNKIFAESDSEGDISDISGLSTNMATNGTVKDSTADIGGEVSQSQSQSMLHLSDENLSKIADILRGIFQPQVSDMIATIPQTQLSTLVGSIVNGVLDGLKASILALEQENQDEKTS